MKITKTNTAPERKLVAVLGIPFGGSRILFLSDSDGQTYYLRSDGRLRENVSERLETVASRRGRTPIYEGDTITITF